MKFLSILLGTSLFQMGLYAAPGPNLSCKGVKLVTTCGNHECNEDKGETALNCPADCIPGVIRSYNHEVICDAVQEIRFVQNVEEVQDIVRYATYRDLKVKPVGALHSASEVICTEGVAVVMSKMNKVIGIKEMNSKKVVETMPGVTVFELSEWLYERGYALAGIPNMGFRDLTVGGAVATGSHGSSSKHTAVISNIVEAVEFVDGRGLKRYVQRNSGQDNAIKGLSASLGLLGITTKLWLEIQPKFNLEVKVTYHKEDKILKNDGVLAEVSECDYGQMLWFPGQKRFIKMCGVKTDKKAQKDANNTLLNPGLPAIATAPFKQFLQLGACFNSLMCMIEGSRFAMLRVQPPLYIRGPLGMKHYRHKVVGPVHRMVSSHFTSEGDGFFQMDWEIAVPASRAQEAAVAIKEFTEKYNICPSLIGVFIRFAPSENKTLLAHTVSNSGDWKEGGPAVYFELPIFLPVGLSEEDKAAYERPYFEYAKMLIEDFSGRPHWAKNRSWTFPLVLSKQSYPGINAFKRLMRRYDPNGVFENDFSRMLNLSLSE